MPRLKVEILYIELGGIHILILVVTASSKSADYLLRKCSGVIPIISFLLAHCEQTNPTEPLDEDNEENIELLNLCCSTSMYDKKLTVGCPICRQFFIEMLVKNQNFRQKSKFSTKIKIFHKNENFGQKYKF